MSRRAQPESPPGVADAESALLARHARGEPGAFSELVARFRAPVYGYLVRSGVPSDVRDDLFQDAFMKIHAAADRFDPSRSAKAWIFTIVANTVRSHYRAAKTRGAVLAAPVDDEGVAPDASSHDWVEADQTADALEEALAKLPRMQREVVLLCCVEQLPQKDVAHALEIPANTVKTHLHRGRLALARALARRKIREVPS